MPNWKKLIVSGSDASLNSLNVTNNVTAQSFTGSFSGSFTAPGATTQIVYNSGGTLAADSGLVYSGSNVGIGTSSPAYNLDVNGTARVGASGGSGQFYIKGFAGSGQYLYLDDGSKVWSLVGGTNYSIQENGTSRLTVREGGNVGIGTTSPGAKLQITGGTLDGASLTDLGISSGLTTGRLGTFDASSLASISTRGDASSVELAAGSSATYYTGISATANNATLFTGTLRFFTSGSEKVRITPAGNLVINSVTTPYIDDKLYVAAGNLIVDNNRGYLQYTTGGARATLLALNSSNNLSVGQSNANNASLLLHGGTGNVTVNAAAIEVARFTTAGNVGIGTTSPATGLDIQTDYKQLTLGNTSGTQAGYMQFRRGGDGQLLAKMGYSSAADGNTFQAGLIGGGSSEFRLTAGNASSSFLTLYTTDTERVRVTGSGNVGIGTTAPTNAKVHIVGDGSYVGNYGYNTLTLEDTGGYPGINLRQGNNNWLIRKDNSQNLQFVFSSNASGPGVGTYSPLINITSSGNVGIGTNSPAQKLHVVGKALITDDVQLTGSNPRIDFNSNGASSLRFYDTTNASERVRIDTAGNVGIGTTSPATTLQVNGTARATRLNSTGGVVDFDAETGNNFIQIASNIVSIANGGNISTTITAAGNVGIGTTSPSQKLHVSAGNFLISGTAIGSGADANSGLRIVAPISTTHYNWMLGAQQNINSAFEITPSTTVGGTTFSTPTAVFLQNGNVGIGTTNPTAQLHIKSTGEATLTLDSAASNASTIYFKENGTSTHYISADGSVANNPLKFYDYTLGAVAMTINAGNIGIGTTSPTQKLDVAGAISVSGSVVDYKVSPAAIAGITTSNIVSFTPGTTKAAFVDYVIVDSSGATNQRVGTIMVSINLNSVSAVINETTTVDIGNTSAVSFGVSYGAPTWLTATNSGITPYDINYMVRYF